MTRLLGVRGRGAALGAGRQASALFEAGNLGRLLVRTLRRFHAVTGGGDYNLVHRAPALRNHHAPWALWHMELLPRHVREAGYELASGMFCTTTLPEESAARLRDAF